MTFWTGLLIGLLLGWVIEWLVDWFYWRRRAAETPALPEADAALQAQLTETENRLAAVQAESESRLRDVGREWQTRLSAVEAENRDLKTKLAAATTAVAAAAVVADGGSRAAVAPAVELGAEPPTPVVAAVAAKTAPFELPAVIDDLTTIEGIGPVYASRLRMAGITSYAALANADATTLADAVKAAAWQKPNYQDWIRQAKLVVAGDEAGLKELQDQLFARPKGDNLAAIQGIGERYAAALEVGGITTYAALAASSSAQLDEMVKAAGLRSTDYGPWIAEAKLRAAGVRVRSKHSRPVQRVRCPQDLSSINGIGPVFEERLYRAGIGSYWEVAEMANVDLAAVLGEPADYNAIRASALQQATATNTIGRGWDGTPPDDLETMPGIGEVYEKRLYAAGICSYDALAAATPEQLAEICQAPRGRTPDYEGWITEAKARAAARETNGQ